MSKLTTITGTIVALLITSNAFSQGNNNGNANQNNNANGTALKWDRQGNSVDTSDFVGTTNERALKLKTNNEQRLVITPDGRIGVGIWAPLEKFDVLGTIRTREDLKVDGSFYVGGQSYFTGNVAVNGQLKLDNVLPATGGNNDIIVRGEDGVLKRMDYEALSAIIYFPRTCSDDGNVLNPTWSSGTNKLYTACPEVNVGVGTTSPEFRLHTVGTGYFSGGIRIGNITTPPISAFIEGHHTIQNSRPWIRFTVDEGGEDKTAFLVNKDGGVYCTSLRVRLREDIPIPDFVFKKEYNLMPLNEVKEFITLNSHLPNIPSENEIRTDGLSIEEMQLKLLQKIEEMTLYLIQLDEENKRLENQIRELSEKNK